MSSRTTEKPSKIMRTKGTTPKTQQFKMNQESATTNNGCGESSFRVLYYGNLSAGSVPFMWESQPGTPKHITTESTLPTLTPPPSFNQLNKKHNSLKHTTSLQTLFLSNTSKQTHVSSGPTSSTFDSFTSYGSCVTQPTSLRSLFLASSFRRDHVIVPPPPSYVALPYPVDNGDEKRRCGGGSSTVTRCFGDGLVKVYNMKKVKSALMSIGSHGKIHKN